MTLIEKISGDMTAAMRSKDQARLAPLRMAKAALMNREVEKGRALDESRVPAGGRVAHQATARFGRAVHDRRPPRARSARSG